MKFKISLTKIILPVVAILLFTSCEDFFEPTPQTVIKEKDFFSDWADFRTAEMGLYSIQQDLVEQLVVLGELRADLLEPTQYANSDLLDVNNLNITTNNRYASPVNFYKLIANCNNLLVKIRQRQPSVLDMSNLSLTNYDRLHASVLAMRAWTYFNAVRIYGKVPYVPDFITNIDDIKTYVNTGSVIIDTLMIRYQLTPGDKGGISYADTIRDTTIVLNDGWLDMYAIIDTFTTQLETMVKYEGLGVDSKPVIGVDYNIDGVNDEKWEITTWNQYAYYCLLGQLSLTYGDLEKAEHYFRKIVFFTSSTEESTRFRLASQVNGSWANIFTSLDLNEHILALDFDKSQRQQNDLQRIFSPIDGNQYLLKPTKGAVFLWENGEWTGWRVNNNGTGGVFSDDYTRNPGSVGDWYRGNGATYAYYKDGVVLSDAQMKTQLELRFLGKDAEAFNFMANVDTAVYKYNIGDKKYAGDADFIIYRATSIHLYLAEIYHRMKDQDSDIGASTRTADSQNILFEGTPNELSKGVRGRVGLQKTNVPGLTNVYYVLNPYTAEIESVKIYKSLVQQRNATEDYIIQERAKELAYEGERFYDIMRIADRRNDPSYLADKISAKFRGSKRAAMREKLMNRENWFVPFDLGIE